MEQKQTLENGREETLATSERSAYQRMGSQRAALDSTELRFCSAGALPAVDIRIFTSLAVFSSESKRAVAAEGAPQVHTGAPVQTRVVVAEMSLGGAPWYQIGESNRLLIVNQEVTKEQ